MSEHTDVRTTMSRSVREEQKRSARQVEAFSRAGAVDLNKLDAKNPERKEALAKRKRR
jgi:hypothetical protein